MPDIRQNDAVEPALIRQTGQPEIANIGSYGILVDQ